MNFDHLILGYATVYGEPPIDGGDEFRAEQFDRFLQDPTLLGYPSILLFHRDPLVAAERLGYWYAFRHVVGVEGMPDGLLALGLLGESPAACSVAAEVGADVKKWALSIGAKDVSDADDRSQMWLGEVTIARRLQPSEKPRPGWHTAFDRAAVLRVGDNCVTAWELLTGEARMPLPPDRQTQTVYGPPVIVGRTVHRASWQEWI